MDCHHCKFSDCVNDIITYAEFSAKDTNKEVSKEQRKARDRANRYAEKHREENRKRSLDYYYKNRERLNERAKQWSKDNHLRVVSRKREKYQENPELYRQKQRDYRSRVKANLPHCDECEECILVQKDKGDGYRRLCIRELRLIEQKVSNSPQWCYKRKEKKNEDNSE